MRTSDKKNTKSTPIRHRIVKGYNYSRVPYDGPLTPRLRKEPTSNAIGFTVDLLSNERRFEDEG